MLNRHHSVCHKKLRKFRIIAPRSGEKNLPHTYCICEPSGVSRIDENKYCELLGGGNAESRSQVLNVWMWVCMFLVLQATPILLDSVATNGWCREMLIWYRKLLEQALAPSVSAPSTINCYSGRKSSFLLITIGHHHVHGNQAKCVPEESWPFSRLSVSKNKRQLSFHVLHVVYLGPLTLITS